MGRYYACVKVNGKEKWLVFRTKVFQLQHPNVWGAGKEARKTTPKRMQPFEIFSLKTFPICQPSASVASSVLSAAVGRPFTIFTELACARKPRVVRGGARIRLFKRHQEHRNVHFLERGLRNAEAK